MKCITYKGGYKYQLKRDYSVEIPIKPESDIPSASKPSEYILLSTNGMLLIKCGYAWDGPSGPTIDTQNFMRGSLIHDALYQLIREGHLTEVPHREQADRLLKENCIEDGMSSIRAWWVYHGVRLGGGPAVDPDRQRPIKQAPKGCE
jgi:hypothetical protein